MRVATHRGFLRYLVCIALVAAPARIQGNQQPPTGDCLHGQPAAAENQRFEPELQSIIDAAFALPAELSADLLIRIAQSTRLKDKKLRVELLTKAFYQAEGAQHDVKRHSLPGSAVDTRSGYLSRAHDIGLDRLSLQTRVASALLPLDVSQARELFLAIKVPTLEPLSCQEPLVYDLSQFYETATKVLSSPADGEHSERIGRDALLSPYLAPLQTHTQVGPAVRLLLSANLSDNELLAASDIFSGALRRFRGDERSFVSIATGSYGLVDSVAALVRALEERKLPAQPVLQAARDYLVANFGGTRCGEMLVSNNSLPPAIQSFNDQLGEAFAAANISPIRMEELQDFKAGSKADIQLYWRTPVARALLREVKSLRFGNGSTPLSVVERNAPEWGIRHTDFLNNVAAWKAAGQDEPTDVFHQKCVLYWSVIELIPTKSERFKAIHEQLRFLELNSFQRSNRIEWFLHVKDLLTYGLRGDAELQREVLGFLAESRDPIISAYARMERWR